MKGSERKKKEGRKGKKEEEKVERRGERERKEGKGKKKKEKGNKRNEGDFSTKTPELPGPHSLDPRRGFALDPHQRP